VLIGSFSLAHADESSSNLWDNLRYSFKLGDEYQRPEVNAQFNWLMSHKNYLNLLGQHSQPYLYYILQEVRKRNMPGELALLPMIESTYNPFAYSNTGAAGLWQFTTGTGNNFGLKQNWWFDGRRDIYNSTNAALNYLAYLHRFFNGNWMLAIAAYHSGEGTVMKAVNNRGTSNFWSLNLPDDTHSYVPKLLALARLILTKNPVSSRLPYISNTPYFTKIDVGTQIDLTNAAHLAGLSYPEFLKLNPGNNRWATSPTGPHTIVLPLNKVDIFVHNLEKIPESQRHTLLAKHAVEFDTDLEAIPDSHDDEDDLPITVVNEKPVELLASVPAPSQKITYASPTIVSAAAPQSFLHKVLHVVQKGEMFSALTSKYHVSVDQIRSWNNLSAEAPLQLGAKLTIWTNNNVRWAKSPATTPSAKNTIVYYTVRVGDSLAKIAQKYHVSLQKLMFWNTKMQPSHLVPGKQLVIYL
jgi:membrane-bound lytic murein transglycosylase D